MTRFEELINLIESFQKEIIDLDFFCTEFFRVYFETEPDSDKIPQQTDKFMKELAMMCMRYKREKGSPFSFYSEKDLLTKIGCWNLIIKRQ